MDCGVLGLRSERKQRSAEGCYAYSIFSFLPANAAGWLILLWGSSCVLRKWTFFNVFILFSPNRGVVMLPEKTICPGWFGSLQK